jgi:hypothetical protein
VSGKVLKKIPNHFYEALVDPDLTLLDDQEIQTLEHLRMLCKQYGVQKLYDMSHKERGYQETDESDLISYNFAKDLQIQKLQINS